MASIRLGVVAEGAIRQRAFAVINHAGRIEALATLTGPVATDFVPRPGQRPALRLLAFGPSIEYVGEFLSDLPGSKRLRVFCVMQPGMVPGMISSANGTQLTGAARDRSAIGPMPSRTNQGLSISEKSECVTTRPRRPAGKVLARLVGSGCVLIRATCGGPFSGLIATSLNPALPGLKRFREMSNLGKTQDEIRADGVKRLGSGGLDPLLARSRWCIQNARPKVHFRQAPGKDVRQAETCDEKSVPIPGVTNDANNYEIKSCKHFGAESFMRNF